MTVWSDAVSTTDQSERVYCRCGHDTAQSSSPMLLHVSSIIMHHQHFDVYSVCMCILYILVNSNKVIVSYICRYKIKNITYMHMLHAPLEI